MSGSNDHSSRLNDRRTFGNRSSSRRSDRKADSFSQRVISMTRGFITMTLGVKTLVLRAIPSALRIKTVPARVITLGERDSNVDSASENGPGASQNDGRSRDNEASARHHDASASGTHDAATSIVNGRRRERMPGTVSLGARNCSASTLIDSLPPGTRLRNRCS